MNEWCGTFMLAARDHFPVLGSNSSPLDRPSPGVGGAAPAGYEHVSVGEQHCGMRPASGEHGGVLSATPTPKPSVETAV